MLMKLQKDKGQRQIKSGFEILSPNVQQQQELMDQGRVSREKQDEEERKNRERERERRKTSKSELALLGDDRQGLPGVEGDECLECS